MYSKVLLGLAVSLSLVASASATTIAVGDHNLLANTPNQIVQIYAEGADQVAGFNLRAQIGADGADASASPKFTSMDYSGAIWGASSAYTLMGAGPDGGGKYGDKAVILNGAGSTVTGSGLIVTLVIDTTNFSSGTFALDLADTDWGQDSDFSGDSATITNGTITVIPEPGTLSLLALGGLAMIRRRRRKA